mmetsp:Transcript_36028/g.113152  ORF Transcript_36028/g.113152 Transcript_36028/m.113152 type:complete len:183 (+) Transcript_36028:29-577(+)
MRAAVASASPRSLAAPALRRAAPLHTEARIKELGLTLPAAGTPKANYTIACWESPTRLYLSGHLPIKPDGSMATGTVGGEGGLSLEEAQEAAKWCGLGLLATIQDQLGGDLDRVEQVVKLFGIVASAPEFKQQHLVLNGCSDVMMAVLGGERGYHARSAIGTNTLPLDSPVEVEAIITVKPA